MLSAVGFRTTAIAATGGGGGAVTVTGVVAETPSTCVVIVALPALIALTCPDGATVATDAFELVRFTARFSSNAPFISRTTAERSALSPATSERADGDTTTDAAVISVTATGAD